MGAPSALRVCLFLTPVYITKIAVLDESAHGAEACVGLGNGDDVCLGILDDDKTMIDFRQMKYVSIDLPESKTGHAVDLRFSLRKMSTLFFAILNLDDEVAQVISDDEHAVFAGKVTLRSINKRAGCVFHYNGVLSVDGAVVITTVNENDAFENLMKRELRPDDIKLSRRMENDMKVMKATVKEDAKEKVVVRTKGVARVSSRLFADPSECHDQLMPSQPMRPRKQVNMKKSHERSIPDNSPSCFDPKRNVKVKPTDHYRPLPSYYKPLNKKSPTKKKPRPEVVEPPIEDNRPQDVEREVAPPAVVQDDPPKQMDESVHERKDEHQPEVAEKPKDGNASRADGNKSSSGNGKKQKSSSADSTSIMNVSSLSSDHETEKKGEKAQPDGDISDSFDSDTLSGKGKDKKDATAPDKKMNDSDSLDIMSGLSSDSDEPTKLGSDDKSNGKVKGEKHAEKKKKDSRFSSDSDSDISAGEISSDDLESTMDPSDSSKDKDGSDSLPVLSDSSDGPHFQSD